MAVINCMLFMTGAMCIATMIFLLFGLAKKWIEFDERILSAMIELIIIALIMFKLWSL